MSSILKKWQRQRANQRHRKLVDKRFEDTLGPMPAHVRALMNTITGNIPDPHNNRDQQDSWERAPSYMVEYDEYPSINKDTQRALTEKASKARTERAIERAKDLRAKYKKYWRTPSGAGIISRAETLAGEPISERTVRELFKKI